MPAPCAKYDGAFNYNVAADGTITAKPQKDISPKTAGHTQSYDFQAARINKCFKLLTGFSR